jgi:hypothetical protein
VRGYPAIQVLEKNDRRPRGLGSGEGIDLVLDAFGPPYCSLLALHALRRHLTEAMRGKGLGYGVVCAVLVRAPGRNREPNR